MRMKKRQKRLTHLTKSFFGERVQISPRMRTIGASTQFSTLVFCLLSPIPGTEVTVTFKICKGQHFNPNPLGNNTQQKIKSWCHGIGHSHRLMVGFTEICL